MNLQELRDRFESPQEKVKELSGVDDILPGVYCVYILTIGNNPVVVGHGKKNRARVIFDNRDTITPGHIKAIIVRLYTLFGSGDANSKRYLIECESKAKAKEIEKQIHDAHGGNTLSVPDSVREKLFRGLCESSPVRMVLRMALCSSFDGITDLKRWRRDRILDDQLWEQIAERLQLPRAI